MSGRIEMRVHTSSAFERNTSIAPLPRIWWRQQRHDHGLLQHISPVHQKPRIALCAGGACAAVHGNARFAGSLSGIAANGPSAEIRRE
jgi:hypothetical protein